MVPWSSPAPRFTRLWSCHRSFVGRPEVTRNINKLKSAKTADTLHLGEKGGRTVSQIPLVLWWNPVKATNRKPSL